MKLLLIIILLIIIFSIFYIYGTKMIFNQEEIIKFKKKPNELKNITNIMINNYYGNLIISAGIILDLIIINGIFDIYNWLLMALAIIGGYVKHVSESSGLSIDETLLIIIKNDRNNRKLRLFQNKTISIALSFIVTGIIMTNVIYPILF